MGGLKNVKGYCETAKNILEKLHGEYLKPLPLDVDTDTAVDHIDTVVNSYDYIAFLIGVLNDSITRADSIIDEIIEYTT